VTETLTSTATGARLPTLGVVGAGRAGAALSVASVRAGYRVVAVASRDPSDAALLAGALGARTAPTALAAVRSAELTLLTVPDRAIADVASTIAASGMALRGRAVVHCAASLGTGPLAALRIAGATVGVLHPLQALAGPRSAGLLRGSYFRIDAHGSLEADLLALVDALGGRRLVVPERGLALYHAAAVLAATAPFAVLEQTVSLLEGAGVDPVAARPALAALISGAAVNAAGGPAALTGPVVRGDAATIAAHLDALAPYPEARALYLAVASEVARRTGADPVALGLAAASPQGRDDVPPMSRVA
jgi:predicted short-subunit dehydrogenase-like oxidoreductase (DUF2520 family)